MALFYRKKQYNQIIHYFKNILYILVILAFLLNIAYNFWFFQDYSDEKYLYEGRANVLSAEYFFKSRLNPYEEKVDLSGEIDVFSGYKYMPLMFILYSPFTLLFGKIGILYFNIIIYVAFLIISYFLIKKIYGKNSYVQAKYLLFFLSCYVITFEVFYRGINDLIPAFFVLCSLTLFFYKKNTLAGIFLGLSIATKPFPGIFLFLLFLLNKKFKLIVYSLITSLIFIIPFLMWNFWAFFLNIIYFNILRHTNPSSIYYFMPDFVRSIWIFLLLFVLGFLFYKWIKSKKKEIDILYYFTLISTVFLLMNKLTHRNYLIWVVPFILLILVKRIDFVSVFKS